MPGTSVISATQAASVDSVGSPQAARLGDSGTVSAKGSEASVPATAAPPNPGAPGPRAAMRTAPSTRSAAPPTDNVRPTPAYRMVASTRGRVAVAERPPADSATEPPAGPASPAAAGA